jgi:hypothetical protein
MFRGILKVYFLLSILLTPYAFSSDANIFGDNSVDRQEDHKTFYLLFKAKDDHNNSALFLPTEHCFMWDKLPDLHKNHVLSRRIAAVEHLDTADFREVTHKLMSKENLDSKMLFTENPWFFPDHHQEYQRLFTSVAEHFTTMGFDYSYLHDISHIKPGILANICTNILPWYSPHQSLVQEGMDAKIETIFSSSPNKQVVSLETPQDIFDCLGIYSASYEDVEDDFNLEYITQCVRHMKNEFSEKDNSNGEKIMSVSSFYVAGIFPRNFQEAIAILEKEMEDELVGASLLVFDGSIGKRTKRWMPKIPDLVSNNNGLGAVGSFHFLGPEGLLTLGQQAGLKWQFLNAQGEWEDFTYPLDSTH